MPRVTKMSITKPKVIAPILTGNCENCHKTKEDCKKTIEQLESKHKQITDILSSQYKKDSLKLKEAVEEHKRVGEEIYNNQITLNKTIEKENTSLREKNHSLNEEISKLEAKIEELQVANLKNTIRGLPKLKRGVAPRNEV